MNILIVGNAGREHALAWKLRQSASVSKIYVAPGNGGTADGAKVCNVEISVTDFDRLVDFAQSNAIDLVIPGPEQPLVDGIETRFRKIGIPVFGPSQKAAQMEGSKAFSKAFMARHKIPTAEFNNFTDFQSACDHVLKCPYRMVIKASGLAAGKGVILPESREEAIATLRDIMVNRAFGSAGDEVVIEEYIEGNELSILSLSDGYSIVDFPASQDHKRIGEGDQGLNTGGMGTYAPTPMATPELLARVRSQITEPTIAGMRRDGFPFRGVLFTGIMVTPSGEPKVLEYNVRFGDPETQTVLALLDDKTDLALVLLACAEGRLDSVDVKFKPNTFAATVVMSAAGYPESYNKGDQITVDYRDSLLLFHAGTARGPNGLVTAGGRVVAATGVGTSLQEALDQAYRGVDAVSFPGKYFRRDIAHRALHNASSKPHSLTYEQSGVSVEAGNALVRLIKNKVRSTARSGTSADIGGFGGLFDLAAAGYNSQDSLLVAATDGVGTKLKIAQSLGVFDTVGVDLVAMNANDLVVQGAEPLFFLDYFASGHLDLSMAESFVSGVADGCLQAGCALVGGETAEMPDMYTGNDFDVNGTCVGAVKRPQLLPKTNLMSPGNVIIGLASSGCHSNGYSLVRKVLSRAALTLTDPAPWSPFSELVGQSLLTPTRIYVKSLLPLIQQDLVLGMAHITGGGLVENIPRILPSNLCASLDAKSWPVPEVLSWLGRAGNVPKNDIVKTLNMGIGMVLVVQEADAAKVQELLEASGEKVYRIGVLNRGEKGCFVKNMDSWY